VFIKVNPTDLHGEEIVNVNCIKTVKEHGILGSEDKGSRINLVGENESLVVNDSMESVWQKLMEAVALNQGGKQKLEG